MNKPKQKLSETLWTYFEMGRIGSTCHAEAHAMEQKIIALEERLQLAESALSDIDNHFGPFFLQSYSDWEKCVDKQNQEIADEAEHNRIMNEARNYTPKSGEYNE